MSTRIPAARAVKLYTGFRESKPKRAKAVTMDYPRVVVVMGFVDAISYTAIIRGHTRRYKHTFAKGSKPMLTTGTGTNQLVLVGGRYHVTDRGIVDLTPDYHEIED